MRPTDSSQRASSTSSSRHSLVRTGGPEILILDHDSRFYAHAFAAAYPGLSIHTASSASEARAWLDTSDILIAFGSAISPSLLARAGKLKWIQALSAGTETILASLGSRRDVLVTSASGIHGPFLSEMAILGMLALARDLPALIRHQQQARWERRRGKALAGKQVIVVGTGASGTEIRRVCAALGMRVMAASRSPRPVPHASTCIGLDDIEAHLQHADYLVLATQSSEQTRNRFDRRLFARMKAGAYLVNLARGDLLNDADLVEALDAGHLGGAMLDAFRCEPLTASHPFWHHPRILLTPHISGYVERYEQAVLPLLLENLGRYLTGQCQHMQNIVSIDTPPETPAL